MPRERRMYARRDPRAPRKRLAPPVTGAARRAILRARRDEEEEVDSGIEDVFQVSQQVLKQIFLRKSISGN